MELVYNSIPIHSYISFSNELSKMTKCLKYDFKSTYLKPVTKRSEIQVKLRYTQVELGRNKKFT